MCELSKKQLEDLNAHFRLSIERKDPYYVLFLKKGADPNTGFGIGIKAKVEENDLDAVKILHHYRAELEPGLNIAVQEKNIKIASYLLENDAKPDIWLLDYAIKNKDIPMIRLLIQYNIEVAERNKKELKEQFGIDLNKESSMM